MSQGTKYGSAPFLACRTWFFDILAKIGLAAGYLVLVVVLTVTPTLSSTFMLLSHQACYVADFGGVR